MTAEGPVIEPMDVDPVLVPGAAKVLLRILRTAAAAESADPHDRPS